MACLPQGWALGGLKNFTPRAQRLVGFIQVVGPEHPGCPLTDLFHFQAHAFSTVVRGFRLLKNDTEIGLVVERHDQPSRSVSVRGIRQLFETECFREPTQRLFLIADENRNQSERVIIPVLLLRRADYASSSFSVGKGPVS
jgi:hypothetical protein